MRASLLSLALACGLAANAAAQGVVVAPHAIVIDHRTRSTAITLYNPGSVPAEVSISTFFGYPVTDSAGDFQLATPGPSSGLPSAAEWIEAYPRRMIIGPLERQTVRLMGRPPAGTPDGEYWSRLLVSAKGGQLPVTADSTPEGIAIGLDLEVRTILPIQYRKGQVRTGLLLDGVDVRLEGDSLALRPALVRQGNAAFVGTARLRLIDAGGAVAAEISSPLAVYVEIRPRLTLPVASLPAGEYRLDLELVTERVDLPHEQLVPAEPVRHSVVVTLP